MSSIVILIVFIYIETLANNNLKKQTNYKV